MIISASRRTDIPAFYGQWFSNRLDHGFCLVPNPFRRSQVARVDLTPDAVDAFVFWTRNAEPFLPVLDELDRLGHRYMFLYTLTAYAGPLEPHAPPREAAIVDLRRLADRIGPGRVVWRYDPILLGPGLGVEDHIERFAILARELAGATSRVKISFVDLYRKTIRRLRAIAAGSYLTDPASDPRLSALIRGLADAAEAADIKLETCAEPTDHAACGAAAGSCIDGDLLSGLFGRSFPRNHDPGQRTHCRCAPSKDIGMNDSCLHGCEYCYATRSHSVALGNHAAHDPSSPALLPLLSKPRP